MYKDDKKKLRTGTTLYGELYDPRWQTHIQKPLTLEELNEFENEYGGLPNQYKELLRLTNGCYLFDLIRVAGKQNSFRGMSIAERVFQPCSLKDLQVYVRNKKTSENLFIFADSLVRDSFFAFNEAGYIVEKNSRNLKTINSYATLEEILDEIFVAGKEMVEKNEYIEFE